MPLLLCVYRYHYYYYDHHHRHQVAVIIVFFTIPLKFVLIWGILGKESSLPVFTRLQRKKEKLSLHVRTGNCFKMSTWPKIKERKREREWIITKIKMTIIGKKKFKFSKYFVRPQYISYHLSFFKLKILTFCLLSD